MILCQRAISLFHRFHFVCSQGTVRLVRPVRRPVGTAESNKQVRKNIPVSTSVHLDLMFTQNYLSRDARKTEDKTFVAAPFQPVEPGTEWERSAQLCSFFFHICNFFIFHFARFAWLMKFTFSQGGQVVRLQPEKRQKRERCLSDALDTPAAEAD